MCFCYFIIKNNNLIYLHFPVSPQSIQLLDEEGNSLKNSTMLGPLREGHTLGATCEVRGARPAPTVHWFQAGKRLMEGKSKIFCLFLIIFFYLL